MELKTEIRDFNGIPIVEVIGEVDSFTCSALRDTVQGLLDGGETNVVINMDAVEYIDSTGLGTLVSLLKYSSEHSRQLYLSVSNPMVRKVLNITGLDLVLPLKATDAEAAASFQPAVST